MQKTQNSPKFLFLLLTISLSLPRSSSAAAPNDLITETCNDFRLCNSTLRSDPRSKTADPNGLSLIAKSNATASLKNINKFISWNDLITETCRSTPDFRLCNSIIRSDPRSKTADSIGLSLIAINAAKSNAAASLNNINKLITINPKLKAPLKRCKEIYEAIVREHIPKAAEALKRKDSIAAGRALSRAGGGINECRKCLVGLWKTISRETKEAMEKMGNFLNQLINLAKNIVRRLRRKPKPPKLYLTSLL